MIKQKKNNKNLAIIAGQGTLPFHVAKVAEKSGYNVFVFPIEGQADSVFEGFVAMPIRLGAIEKTRKYLLDNLCNEMLMVGKVTWPSFSALRPDAAGIKLLGRLVKRGDDSVLRVIASYFEEYGIKTIPVSKFMMDRVMPSGHVAGPVLSAESNSLVQIGIDVLHSLGECDVGQAIVLQNGRVLAVEAAEGTSAMLNRSADLIDSQAGSAVFVKMQKSGQDYRLDTPFIGIETLQAAVHAGVQVVAIEHGKVLLANDVQVMSNFCLKHRLTFVGIAPAECL